MWRSYITHLKKIGLGAVIEAIIFSASQSLSQFDQSNMAYMQTNWKIRDNMETISLKGVVLCVNDTATKITFYTSVSEAENEDQILMQKETIAVTFEWNKMRPIHVLEDVAVQLLLEWFLWNSTYCNCIFRIFPDDETVIAAL